MKPAQHHVELVSVLIQDAILVFDVTAHDGRKSALALSVEPAEMASFERVFAGRPFGTSKTHQIALHSLKYAAALSCTLRVSAGGSRRDTHIPVSPSTMAGLEYVIRRFAIDAEMVPDKPANVAERQQNQAPNHSIEAREQSPLRALCSAPHVKR